MNTVTIDQWSVWTDDEVICCQDCQAFSDKEIGVICRTGGESSCGGKDISETDVTEELDLKYDKLFLEQGECAALDFLATAVERMQKKH